MTEQEIKAKALEIAVLIRGDVPGKLSGDGETIIRRYLAIADAAEQYIRGTLKQEEPSKKESL